MSTTKSKSKNTSSARMPFSVRLSEDEAATLRKLARHFRVTPSTHLRRLIEASADALAACDAADSEI